VPDLSSERPLGSAKDAFRIFVLAFLLNWIWEALHAAAYVESTGPLFFRFRHCLPMAATDAFWTLALWLASAGVGSLADGRRWRLAVVAALGFLTAVVVERVALAEGRWTYNDLMPLVPMIDVGLWPVAQMTILPVITVCLARVRPTR